MIGTKGTAEIMKHQITGENPWKSKIDPQQDDMYQNEHDELFASIRKGEPINNGDYMTKSTLLAIMGRMATYTGQVITWEMAMNSKEDLTPPKYEFGDIADAAGGASGGDEVRVIPPRWDDPAGLSRLCRVGRRPPGRNRRSRHHERGRNTTAADRA